MHRSDICIGIGTDIEDISRSGIGDKWADPYLKKIYILLLYIFFTFMYILESYSYYLAALIIEFPTKMFSRD